MSLSHVKNANSHNLLNSYLSETLSRKKITNRESYKMEQLATETFNKYIVTSS
jgi:hypothetical protein